MNMHTTFPDVRTPARAEEPAGAAAWHMLPAAIGLAAAISDLTAISVGIEAIRAISPTLHSAADAEALIGRIITTLAPKDFARGYEHRMGPSNGTCGVSVLWEAMRDVREGSIRDQMKAEGLPFFTDAGLDQAQLRESLDRYDELEQEAMPVWQAIQLATAAGRA